MSFISEPSISLGKYVVSPTTHQTDAGDYRASVAIQSGQGTSAHHRVFRFESPFATREAARVFAVTQGWIQTHALQSRMC